MSSGITLSAGVRQNLLSLQNTADMMATTQNRLATGKKVTSALDNPSNFFTATSLQSRASDLNSLMDSMSNGVKTLQAADNGLTSITNTLESMQSTLRQARQDKSFEAASYSLTNLDPNSGATHQLSFSGGAFSGTSNLALTTTGSGQTASTSANYAVPAASAATYTGAQDVDAGGVTAGTLTVTYGGTSVTLNMSAVAAAAGASTTAANNINTALTGTALEGKITASANASKQLVLTAAGNEDASIAVSGSSAATAFGSGTAVRGSDGSLDFTVNGDAVSLDSTSGSSIANAVANANQQLQDAGSKFQAYNNGGKLGIRATTTDAGSLSIGGNDGDLFAAPSTSSSLSLSRSVDELVSAVNNSSTFNTQIKASNDNGKLRIQNLSTRDLSVGGVNSSDQVIGSSTTSGTIAGNTVRSGLADQYNELRDQLDKLADDASFNGTNLLRGDKLTITFNETGTSSISIQSKDGSSVDSASLGLNIGTDRTTMEAQDLDSDSNIDSFLGKVKTALNSVRSQSSAFGSNLSVVQNRQDFTKSMINTLQTGADNLVLADSNEEGANMLALQTRQQLSTTALSLANQANQAVLRLF